MKIQLILLVLAFLRTTKLLPFAWQVSILFHSAYPSNRVIHNTPLPAQNKETVGLLPHIALAILLRLWHLQWLLISIPFHLDFARSDIRYFFSHLVEDLVCYRMDLFLQGIAQADISRADMWFISPPSSPAMIPEQRVDEAFSSLEA